MAVTTEAPPTQQRGRGFRFSIQLCAFSADYLAGGLNGWLMVVKYWIAAPIATGAVTSS
jgi:hypothetical protein